MRTLYTRRRSFTPTIELLERRLAPAIGTLTIGGTTMASFTDADGDVITARIAGSAGTAVFFDGTGDDVDDGEAIAKITITGASSNFVLTLSVNSSGGGANGNVKMGDITSNKVIRGIYTVADITSGPLSEFDLGSFTGPGFSSGGGLFVTNITGNTAGDGLVINSLGADRVINVRGDVTADVRIVGEVAGTINVGDEVTDASAWTIGSVHSSGFIGAVGGRFEGDVTVLGDFRGVATIGGNANGSWDIGGTVHSTARLTAVHWEDVHVAGHFHGHITAEFSGDIALEVDGNLGPRSRIAAINNVELTVHKSVLAGAQIDARDITAVVDGNVKGQFVTYGEISLDVGGSVDKASLHAGHSDVSLTVAGDVLRSTIIAQQGLTADIEGGMRDSLLASSRDISLDLGGSMLNSTLTSGSSITAHVTGDVVRSFIDGGDRPVSVDIDGSLTDSRVTGGNSDLSLDVAGDIVNSSISTLNPGDEDGEGDMAVIVGGSVVSTQVRSDETLTLDVEGSVSKSTIQAAEKLSADISGSLLKSDVYQGGEADMTVAVDVDMVDSKITAGASAVSVDVGGNVVRSQIIAAGDEATADIDGDLVDSVIAGMSGTSVDVGGSMIRSKIDSASSETTVRVGGDLVYSQISGGSDVSAEVDFDVKGSAIISTADSISLSVGGGVLSEGRKHTTIRASEDVTLDVAGSVSRRSLVSGGDQVSVDATNFDGSVAAVSLDFEVTGNVGRFAVIQTTTVADAAFDGNDIGFSVGGTFAGKLDVAGAFNSGSGATTTLVALGVTSTAKFNIVGPFGAGTSSDAFNFGGDFRGELILGGDLVVDLTFGGDVRKVTIGGVVDEDIVVAGLLKFLSSGSFFDETIVGFDGEFKDGSGAVTGTLDTTGGFDTVIPLF